MKKYMKLIFINIVLLIIIIFLFEFIFYKRVCKIFNCNNSTFLIYKHFNTTKNDIEQRFYDENHDWKFKIFKGPQSNENIIVMGCSMAYGFNLEEHQTFSYKLSNKINKNIYNLAIPGGGVNQILYIFKEIDIKKYIKKEPEKIIYFYQPDHLRRIFIRCTIPDHEESFIIYKKFLNIENSWIYAFFHDKIREGSFKILNKKANDYFFLYLKEINNRIKEIYPNSKFVIVKFSTDEDDFDTKLKSMYNVIDIPLLTNIDVMSNTEENINKYNIDDGLHPNEYYWDTVLPILIRELNKI